MLSLIYSFPPILHFQLAEACSTLIPNSLADFPAGSCIVVDASEVTSWVAPTALRQHCCRSNGEHPNHLPYIFQHWLRNTLVFKLIWSIDLQGWESSVRSACVRIAAWSLPTPSAAQFFPGCAQSSGRQRAGSIPSWFQSDDLEQIHGSSVRCTLPCSSCSIMYLLEG